MVHIYRNWIQPVGLNHIIKHDSEFISFKGDMMWHSPYSRLIFIPAEDIDWGNPAPYNVPAVDWRCLATNLCNGNEHVRKNSGWGYLQDGPGFLEYYLGKHIIVAPEGVCTYNVDKIKYFDKLNPMMRELLSFMKYDSEAQLFYCKRIKLPKGVTIYTGDYTQHEDYKWQTVRFCLNGEYCNFEALLRWAVMQK